MELTSEENEVSLQIRGKFGFVNTGSFGVGWCRHGVGKRCENSFGEILASKWHIKAEVTLFGPPPSGLNLQYCEVA